MSRNMWRTNGRMNFPIDNLELFLPLGHPELSGSPFTSKDLNAHLCTVAGATHVPPTHRAFDGNNQKITIPHAASLNFERTDSFSFSFWMKMPASAVDMAFIDKTEAAPGYKGYEVFQISTNGKVAFLLDNDIGGNNYLYVFSTLAVDDNVWHHIGITYPGDSTAASVKFIIDGVLDTTEVASDTLSLTTQNTRDMTLGIRRQISTLDYIGNLGEVWIWSKELSLVELQHNRRATKWRYV